MLNEPLIRSARREDLGVIVDLLQHGALESGKEDPQDLGPYEAALEEILNAGPSDVLVAEVGGKVVGVCQLIVFRHLQARGGLCAEIESVHVHPTRRSQGIGAALLRAAMGRARLAGCYRVQLTSNKLRPQAHRFYEREGFVPTHVGFKYRLG